MKTLTHLTIQNVRKSTFKVSLYHYKPIEFFGWNSVYFDSINSKINLFELRHYSFGAAICLIRYKKILISL